MQIDIRFFATLKDRAGQDRLQYELSDGATVGDLVQNLSADHPPLAEALPSAIAAINHEYAFESDSLSDGDEVAFFPPVSGGLDTDDLPGEAVTGVATPEQSEPSEEAEYPEFYAITNDELNLNDLVERITLPSTGAVAMFTGTVRGETETKDGTLETVHLVYEAYPEMAEAKLRQVTNEIRERWPEVEGVAIVQRVGKLEVGTPTVLIACSASHRDQGVFEAARYGIDRLKEIVPIWKKEVGPDGEEWVEGHYYPSPEDAPTRAPGPAIGEPASEVVEPADVARTLEGWSYICPACDETYALDTWRWQCECGQVFELEGTPPFDSESVATDTYSMWRYRAMLLPDGVPPVTLGEGWTPLLPTSINGRDVHLKLEMLNPTGSFKDRGTAVHISMLRAIGVSAVHDDSSGNAGASMAAYAARAGIPARIYAPAGASPVKLAQVQLYGAELVTPQGPRSAAAHAAEDVAQRRESHYASHVYNPLTVLGMKTMAYEIWEQLGSLNPDAIVLPVGHGTQALGLAAGFRDLLEVGAIDRLPRLIGVQAAVCAPLWAAFNETNADVQENETLAEGIRIVEPVKGHSVLAAIRDSGGSIVTVPEHEISEGMASLARLGILVEPTSAVVVPALSHMDHILPPDATIVLSLTGSGFKSPHLDTIANEAIQAQAEPT